MNETRSCGLVDFEDGKKFWAAAQSYMRGEIAPEKFRPLRLIHGVYLQRQSNLYMLRVRLPAGRLDSEQLERIAWLAETYAGGAAHLTTRQNFQLYGMNLEQTSEVIRHLAEVGITTRGASGNVVRNITACHLAGVCRNEAFDVAPFAETLTRVLIRHPDFQDLPRKFKISFSGCSQDCALTSIHDLGLLACVKEGRQGFKIFVGGGLGAVPRQAQVLEDFVPLDQLIPTVCAVLHIFNLYGKREVKPLARLKFLIDAVGVQEFKQLVIQQMKLSAQSQLFTLSESNAGGPAQDCVDFSCDESDLDFSNWSRTNAIAQRQENFFSVQITVPLGDINAEQMRLAASLSRRFSNGEIRTTNKQNLVIFWVKRKDLYPIYQSLKSLNLHAPCYDRLCDITACPGASSCPSAITNSKALSAELIRFLQNGGRAFKDLISGIKISGCHNSCGQHHAATIGFSGRSQVVDEKSSSLLRALFELRRSFSGTEIPKIDL